LTITSDNEQKLNKMNRASQDISLGTIIKDLQTTEASLGDMSIQSASAVNITGGTISGVGITADHNDLDNIDGGTTDEYYHLTEAQHTEATDREWADGKFGDVAGGDYSEFEVDGTLVAHGDATVWDDMRTPASIAKALPGKEATFVAYRGGLVLNFAKNADQGIAFNVQLPHSYKLGTDIEFHVHAILPTSGAGVGAENLKFDFTHSWAAIGDAMPTETSVPKTTDVQNYVAHDHRLIEIANAISGSSIDGVSSMLICSLTRDVSVANNYDDAVYVMEVDFHFQIDTIGSRQEAVK